MICKKCGSEYFIPLVCYELGEYRKDGLCRACIPPLTQEEKNQIIENIKTDKHGHFAEFAKIFGKTSHNR